MIPEYKLYHGAVLAELIHALTFPIKIDELKEEGRLSSYILDSLIGLHIKHSTSRMNPWGFTFTDQNLSELKTLADIFPQVFVVFVCHTHGMVCCSYKELVALIGDQLVDHPWVRIHRRRGKWFQVGGPGLPAAVKYPNGIDALLEAVKAAPA